MSSTPETYHIYFDEQNRYVIMRWEGYSTSDQFRDGTGLMLQTLKKHQASKVLADIREMVLIGMSDQHWLEQVFLPEAIEAGFRALAILSPLNYFNKVAVETISQSVDKEKLEVRLFNELWEADEWLREL